MNIFYTNFCAAPFTCVDACISIKRVIPTYFKYSLECQWLADILNLIAKILNFKIDIYIFF